MLGGMGDGIKRMSRMLFSGVMAWASQQLGAASSGASWLLNNTKINYEREFGDGSKSDIVMAIAQWKMQTLVEAELVIDYRKERVEEHPLLTLLHKPNEFYDGENLLQGIVLSVALSGNGYCIIVPSKLGTPLELWWTPHTMIHPRWPEDGSLFISHYDYSPDGQNTFKLDPQDVLHFRFGLDPYDTRMGLNPLRSIMREAYTDQESANWIASLMRNGAYPGIIISPNDPNRPYSPDEKERAEKKLQQKFTGDNRGAPLVMSGSTSVANFGWSPQEVDMRGIRRLPEERISAVMNLPAVVAGLGAGLDRSTFSNMAEAREMAYETAIIPIQRMLARTIQQKLLPLYEENVAHWQLYFDTRNIRVLQEDEMRKANRCAVLVRNGIMRIDEARAINGLDVADTDKVYLRPAGLIEVPAGMLGETDEGQETDREEAVEARDQAGQEDAQTPDERDTKAHKTYAGESYHRRVEELKEATPDEVAFIARMVAWGLVLESEMGGELLAKFKLLGALAGTIFERRIADQWLNMSDRAISTRVLQEIKVGEWAQEELRSVYEDSYRRVFERVVTETQLYANRGVNLPDEAMFRVIEQGGKRVGLLDLDGDTKAAIFRTLQIGRQENYNPHRIARLLASEVPAGRFSNAGPAYRAKMIARTEIKYAQNVSSLTVYEGAENIVAVRCFDGQYGPPRSDPDCIARDGQRFSFAEARRINQEEHPNGTLSWAPIVE